MSARGQPGSDAVTLVWPTLELLPSYVAALDRGWSPDTLRAEAAQEELEQIAADPAAFVTGHVDREGAGPPVTLPDGTKAARLPGFGHIGFSVVPWKRERGYATRALGLLLADAQREGLRWVELTTKLENVASQHVIAANGGQLVERFTTPGEYGEREALRFRIELR